MQPTTENRAASMMNSVELSVLVLSRGPELFLIVEGMVEMRWQVF